MRLGMIEYWDYYTFGYDEPAGGMGMATTLPIDYERDFGAELRAVVFEVTGRRRVGARQDQESAGACG